MAYSSFTLLPIFLVIISLLSMVAEGRNLQETTLSKADLLPHLPENEIPTLPKPALPHLAEIPTLPKPALPHLPEIPTLPKPELPHLPEIPTLPKPELPNLPEIPTLPKPELPKIPQLPKPTLPTIPTLPKDSPLFSPPHSTNAP